MNHDHDHHGHNHQQMTTKASMIMAQQATTGSSHAGHSSHLHDMMMAVSTDKSN